MLRFHCPSCNHSLKASNNHAGKVLKCTRCNSPFRAPIPTAVPRRSAPPLPVVQPEPIIRRPSNPLDFDSHQPTRRWPQRLPRRSGLDWLAISALIVTVLGLTLFFLPFWSLVSFPLLVIGWLLAMIATCTANARRVEVRLAMAVLVWAACLTALDGYCTFVDKSIWFKIQREIHFRGKSRQ